MISLVILGLGVYEAIIGHTVSYLTIAPLTGAINQTDIRNLKEMLKALGSFVPIFNILLNIVEKLANKLQKP